MTQQVINIGTAPNDGTGDPARTAFTKINSNFTELYSLPSGGSPGGSNTQVQYNSSGTFGASATFTYDVSTSTMTLGAGASGTTTQYIKAGTPVSGRVDLEIVGGAGVAPSTGGLVRITGGAASATGSVNGGYVYLVGGPSGTGTNASSAGLVSITGGLAQGQRLSNGGNVFITGGQGSDVSTTTALGGNVTIAGGRGGAIGATAINGGTVSITSGSPYTGMAATSGQITLASGDADITSGTSGNVTISTGAASIPGYLYLATNNTNRVVVSPTGSITLNQPPTGQTLTMTGAAVGTAAIAINTSATTGAQTATFTATNKPGSGTTSPSKWLPIVLDGTTYYLPCWT